jgi:hypothetical protein
MVEESQDVFFEVSPKQIHSLLYWHPGIISSTLKMEVTRSYIPEDSILHSHCRENFKSSRQKGRPHKDMTVTVKQ